MIRRILAVVACGALALAPTQVASEPRATPLELTQLTVITTDKAFTAPVRLTEEALIDLSTTERGGQVRAEAMRVTGGDDEHYTGVLLTEPGRTDGFTAMLLEPPEVPEAPRGIVAHGVPHADDIPSGPPLPIDEPPRCQECRIPAGDYDLVVVAAAPVTIELTLAAAPPGTTHIDGTTATANSLTRVDLHFASGSSGNAQASSGSMGTHTFILGGNSLAWLIHHWDLSATTPGPAGALNGSACLEEASSSDIVADTECEGRLELFDQESVFTGSAARPVEARSENRLTSYLEWTMAGGDEYTVRYAQGLIRVGAIPTASPTTALVQEFRS